MIERRTVARRSGTTAVCIFLCSFGSLSCAAPAWQTPDPATWRALRLGWEHRQEVRPSHPWAAGVAVTMRDPRSGRSLDGRGAIAVAPGRALRMILVGVAGATMLDAWVTPDRWRIAVPPAGVLRRGGTSPRRAKDDVDEPNDLPVGFLRWVFFRPLAGHLFGGSFESGGVLFLLRDGQAVVEVRVETCARGERTTTTLRARGRAERLDECRASGELTPGDWVRYEDQRSGLAVDLTVESIASGSPEEEAFRDPDAEGS